MYQAVKFVNNPTMDNFTDLCFVSLHAFLLSNAAFNVFYNFQAEDIQSAPIYFRAAQVLNVSFSLAFAQICYQLGPLRRPGANFEPQGIIVFLSGLAYGVLTGAGKFITDSWGEELRASRSFQYMQSSISVPFQAMLATVLIRESIKVVNSTLWLAKLVGGAPPSQS